MELVAVDEAKVYVELVQDGKRQCDSQITLDIKITSLNGVVTNEHYPKMGGYPACDEASKLNGFSVNTITDGLYEVTAGRTGFETSKCNFRVFHQRAASIPELNPIALLAVFALAFAFLRARRLHGARGN
ncbi:hypothetical protein H0N96_02155 [Candidatus Micrarchaeota archaeon]|nr:hypothetical protein [Candidatus Micrarchaeota archaeon]